MLATSRRSDISRSRIWRVCREPLRTCVEALAFARLRYSIRRSSERVKALFARAN